MTMFTLKPVEVEEDITKVVEQASYVINCTTEKIVMYDNEGGFIQLIPQCSTECIPEFPSHRAVFIVTENQLKELRMLGRDTYDLVMITSKAIGRNGVEVSYIERVQKPSVKKRILIRPHTDCFRAYDQENRYHLLLNA